MRNFLEDEEEVDLTTGLPMVEPQALPNQPQVMNPQVKDYLSKKFNLGEYSNENRKKLAEESGETDFGTKLAAALGAAGAGIMGRDAAGAGNAILNQARSEKKSKVDDFDKARSNKIQEFGLDRDATKAAREDDQFARESDPGSDESKLAQELAVSMGYKGDSSRLTAEQFKQFSPALQKKYEIAQKNLDRADARQDRATQASNKLDEKMMGLKTPYGLANTEDDAKKIKEGHESKKNFDSKLEEIIALREKHGGGAVLDREDVARANQLSKDLLLEYKNMAKLGVMSQADENILNKIIPADPLQYNSFASAIQGQDPTLHTLKKFKGDSDKDFQTRVATRTRGGMSEPIGSGSTTAEVERLDPKTGKVSIFDANTKKFLRFKDSGVADKKRGPGGNG